MLTRVYIDNYRCFVNFEIDLGRQQLILGLNGSGKTTFLDALRGVRDLSVADASLESLFPSASLCRWQTLKEQRFELNVHLDGRMYLYRLRLDQWGHPARTRISEETVLCDGKPVFEFIGGEVHLFNDSFERKVNYPFDWFRSALTTIQKRPENARLMRFKDWLLGLHCLSIDPRRMLSTTDSEDARPNADMSNFAAWYRHLTQERGDQSASFQGILRTILTGLESFDVRSIGGAVRQVTAKFAASDADGSQLFQISFGELADGQRTLIALYAVLEFLVQDGACLFLDEPENFIALSEIQPWLLELQDRLVDKGGQVTLLSHHPEIIDYLAVEKGIVFERIGSGPVRVGHLSSESTLPLSEQAARGWIERQ